MEPMSQEVITLRRSLPHLIETPSASDQIFSRFLKMQLKIETSEIHCVSFITRMGLDSARGISGSNLRVIAKRLCIDGLDVQANGKCRLKHAYVDECTESDYTALSLICQLRECLNGDKKLDGFNLEEIEYILHNVCID